MPKSTHDRTKNKNRNEESLAGFATSKCRSCLSVGSSYRYDEPHMVETDKAMTNRAFSMLVQPSTVVKHGKAWPSMAKPNSEVLAQRSVADSILLKV
jgi:hypothetical protein